MSVWCAGLGETRPWLPETIENRKKKYMKKNCASSWIFKRITGEKFACLPIQYTFTVFRAHYLFVMYVILEIVSVCFILKFKDAGGEERIMTQV